MAHNYKALDGRFERLKNKALKVAEEILSDRIGSGDIHQSPGQRFRRVDQSFQGCVREDSSLRKRLKRASFFISLVCCGWGDFRVF